MIPNTIFDPELGEIDVVSKNAQKEEHILANNLIQQKIDEAYVVTKGLNIVEPSKEYLDELNREKMKAKHLEEKNKQLEQDLDLIIEKVLSEPDEEVDTEGEASSEESTEEDSIKEEQGTV